MSKRWRIDSRQLSHSHQTFLQLSSHSSIQCCALRTVSAVLHACAKQSPRWNADRKLHLARASAGALIQDSSVIHTKPFCSSAAMQAFSVVHCVADCLCSTACVRKAVTALECWRIGRGPAWLPLVDVGQGCSERRSGRARRCRAPGGADSCPIGRKLSVAAHAAELVRSGA